MMFMTAKVDIKKTLIALAAAVGLIIGMIFLFGGSDAAPTAAIPEKSTAVYDRYNALQKTQGYDLSQYAGKIVMRYVYKITNFPGATDPVYATLLVYKNEVIGGDVTDTCPNGQVRTFKMPA